MLLKRGLAPFCMVITFVFCAVKHAGATVIGGDFRLTDQDNRPFQLQQMRGKVVLLFFGYTQCPDICPTELSNVSAVLNALGEEKDQVQGLFVSLDPERDTPGVLKGYTGYFNKDILGLTGSQSEIDSVAKQYRVSYRRHQTSDGRTLLDHPANLYVIDRMGRLSTIVPYGLPPDHVLSVVRRLLDDDI